MKIFEKKRYIRKYRKKWNENNKHSVNNIQRTIFKIENYILLKFLITISIILFFIMLININFENQFQNPLTDITISPYIIDFNLSVSDVNSARYFLSAVPQSLAALLAISFTVLLIYLQISTDTYSIQTVKYILSGRWAVTVFSIFLITIIYSLIELAKLNDNSSAQFDSSIKTLIILTILCCMLLLAFFYKIVANLMPNKFIEQASERIYKSYLFSLDYSQLIRLRYNYFLEKMNEFDNIYGSIFFLSVDSDLEHKIKPLNYGFIQDIDISKIKKCSKLLSSDSADSKLALNINFEKKLVHELDILGSIECSNKKISNKIEKLVQNAYKINHSKNWILEDYNELPPLTSLTTKAIINLEKGVAETALEKMVNNIISYIDVRKGYNLMPTPDQIGEIMPWRSNYLNESFNNLEKVMKVSIKEKDADLIDSILYFNSQIGYYSIKLQDRDAFQKVTQFNLYFSYRLENESIDKLLYYSKDLAQKSFFIIFNEKKEIDFIKNIEYFLNDLIKYFAYLTNIWMEKETRHSITSLNRLLELNSNFSHIIFDNTLFQLQMDLDQLDKTSENSYNYQRIKRDIEIIEEKEKMGKKLKLHLEATVFLIGTKLMKNIEKEKMSIEICKPFFKVLVNFFKDNNLEDIYNNKTKINFFPMEFIIDEVDEKAHFIDLGQIDRFYLLMAALLTREGKDMQEIKPIECFNKIQLKDFEIQTKKLKDRAFNWDQLLENNSKNYFDQLLKRLDECIDEQKNNLLEKVRKADLSSERVATVKSDIISYAQENSLVENLIKIELVDEIDNKSIYFGNDVLYNKIYFVDEDIDPTTSYSYDDIGRFIGTEIGLGESAYILGKIFENLNNKQNSIYFKTPTIQNFNILIEKLKSRGFNATTIISSKDLFNKIRKLKEFRFIHRNSNKNLPYGMINDIEIYVNEKIPKNIGIIFDRNYIGKLKIFKKLNPEITSGFNKDKIIEKELMEGIIKEEQRQERLRELDEKVNIKSLEKIKFEFGNHEAGLVFSLNP